MSRFRVWLDEPYETSRGFVLFAYWAILLLIIQVVTWVIREVF